MTKSDRGWLGRWWRTDFARLFADSAFVFGVRFSAAIITYVTQVVLANWMGAEQLGLFVYAVAWLWILNVLSVMGLASAAYRFIPQYQAQADLARVAGFVRWSRQVAIGVGLLLGGLGLLLLQFVDPGKAVAHREPLMLALAVLPVIALTTLQSGIARACLWFKFASLTGVLLRPALLLVAIVLAWQLALAPSAVRVMGMLVLIILVVAALQFVGLRYRLRQSFSFEDRAIEPRLWLRVAVSIVMAELFVGYFTDINIIISGSYLDPAQIAVFNAALRTVAIMAFGVTAVAAVVAPRAAKLYAQKDYAQLQRLVRAATHLMLWPSVLAFVFLAVFGKTVLGLFGPEFTAGYPALLVAGAAQLFIAASGPLLPLLNVAGQQDRCVVVFVIALVLTPVLYYLLMPRFGMVGGALALLLVSILWCLWLGVLVLRFVGVRPSLLGPGAPDKN